MFSFLLLLSVSVFAQSAFLDEACQFIKRPAGFLLNIVDLGLHGFIEGTHGMISFGEIGRPLSDYRTLFLKIQSYLLVGYSHGGFGFIFIPGTRFGRRRAIHRTDFCSHWRLRHE